MPSRYKKVWIDGKNQYLHRVLWEEANGPIPEGMQIDHINGDRYDNRLENLRVVTRQENMRNARRSCSNTSGVTGVSWNKRDQKWQAKIYDDNGKQVHLGFHANLDDAVAARKEAEERLGYHANHGRATA